MSTDRKHIETRAYQLWEQAGRSHGQHDAHWNQAEQELGSGHLANATHQRGEPDAPEERNPQGHDSQPDPSPIEASVGAGRSPLPVGGDPAIPHPMSKADDASFLVDQFDVPVPKAASLVADASTEGASADRIASEVQSRAANHDPLDDLPTPHTTPTSASAEEPGVVATPVRRTRNRRNGAG